MTKTNGKRLKAEQRGRRAEFLAAMYLRLKGYRILGMRMKTKLGEIDIIAKRGNTLICIEVKQRPTTTDALHAISPQSRKRIMAAAFWLQKTRPHWQQYDLRFDAIAVKSWYQIFHLKHAWTSNDLSR